MSGLYEQATAMRLVPADSVFALLERTARDAAEATGKQVAFEATGGEVRLDAHGLRLLRHALVHLVRNAVTHGVESPASASPRANRRRQRADRGSAARGPGDLPLQRRRPGHRRGTRAAGGSVAQAGDAGGGGTS